MENGTNQRKGREKYGKRVYSRTHYENLFAAGALFCSYLISVTKATMQIVRWTASDN